MESLLASYASSDDEEDRKPRGGFSRKLPKPSTSSSSSLFSALPHPRNPKTSIGEDGDLDSSSGKGKSCSFFSSLPPPKSLPSQHSGSASSTSVPAPPKRVVQIRLPVNPRPSNMDDEEEEDEEEKERKKRRHKESVSHDSSVKSFLSAMPAPKSSATLGVLPSSGSGRRSIIETESPSMTESGNVHNPSNHENHQSFSDNNSTNYAAYGSGVDQSAQIYASEVENYNGYDPNVSASGDNPGYMGYDPNVSASGDASGYVGYDGSYGGNGGYDGQYGSTWTGGSGFDATTMRLPEAVGAIDGAVKRARRGKKDMTPQIVEVKQDDLMKNRPREDQVKSTGIAFGPAYQPASSKGKPTKLHKRKHQITALYFDMKQKETELAERRSRGFLTKAETQAKYGW